MWALSSFNNYYFYDQFQLNKIYLYFLSQNKKNVRKEKQMKICNIVWCNLERADGKRFNVPTWFWLQQNFVTSELYGEFVPLEIKF